MVVSDIEPGTPEHILLSNRCCADCEGPLVPGPMGGASQNFHCDDCGALFNLTFMLVFAQRITHSPLTGN